MRLFIAVSIVGLLVLITTATIVPKASSRCSASVLKQYLPTGAVLENVTMVQNGGGFDEGMADLGYPSPPYSPTGLPELCAVIVNVTSSPTSYYRFGIFMPTTWNDRYLVVGNGGFLGGINWYDMAPGMSSQTNLFMTRSLRHL